MCTLYNAPNVHTLLGNCVTNPMVVCDTQLLQQLLQGNCLHGELPGAGCAVVKMHIYSAVMAAWPEQSNCTLQSNNKRGYTADL